MLDRGRLVVQEDLADAAGAHRPGGGHHEPPRADAVGVLDGRVEERVGTRLVVRAEAAAEVNALLVAGGVPVDELGAERRGLEQVVLEATEGTGDVR